MTSVPTGAQSNSHPASGVLCLIGNGAVVNPAVLLREMDALAARGVDVDPARLKLSGGAHLITPGHIAMDRAYERERGRAAIGTTLRGIGPAYTDKARRVGLRAELLADPAALAAALAEHVASKNDVLVKVYGEQPLDADAIAADFAAYAARLAPHLADGPLLLDEALRRGQTVLAEGAQGTLLDIDHGTYPFVTSSSPTAGGAMTGLGVGPLAEKRVVDRGAVLDTGQADGRMTVDLARLEAALIDAAALPPEAEDIPITVEPPAPPSEKA